MKKEAPQKRKGLTKKTSDKKEAPQKCNELIKKTSDEKNAPPKCQGLSIRISDRKKRFNKANSANQTVEGEGDAFWFKSQVARR
jgi:hypothetical protein